jgi:hypothetical protein
LHGHRLARITATLAVVGDFDPKQAKAWIQKYFADLPQGKAVERPKVPLGKLDASRRLVYEDRVQVPRLYIQYPTVGFKNDDDYALSVMSSILSGSRTARLTKALVYDTQIASQVGAFQNSAEDVGVFQVTVIPRPEHSLTEIEGAVDQVIQKFISEGPTAEELQKTSRAGFHTRTRIEPRQSESTDQRCGFLRQPGPVQYRLPENARSHGCRCEARGESIPDAFTDRAERRAERQERPGFQSGRERNRQHGHWKDGR